MADNPGILIGRAQRPPEIPVGWTNGSFNFVRPGTVLPTFVAPIIGYHDPLQEEGGVGNGGLRSRDTIVKAPRTRTSTPYPFGTNNGILIQSSWYQNFWRDQMHIVWNPADNTRRNGWQAFNSGLTFDAGTVLSTVQTQYEIYNASRTRQGVNTTRTLIDLDGVNEVTPPPLPTDFAGNESRIYTVEITTEGPPTIDGRIEHGFVNPLPPLPVGTPLLFNILGNRLLLFTYEPQRPVLERWETLSDVLQAADGTEQRFSLRQLPAQRFVYDYRFTDETINRKMENFLRVFGTLKLGVPDWASLTELAAPVAPLQQQLTVVSLTNRDFRADGREQDGFVIFDDQDNFEAGTIQSIDNATQFTAVAQFLNAWPVGTTVMPFKVGYFADNWQQTLLTTLFREISLAFNVTDSKQFDDETGFPVYKSRPIFDDPRELGESRQYQQRWQWNMIATGGKASRNSWRTQRRYPLVGSSFIATWDTRADFVRIRNFLHARRGRQKDFWLPTWRDDLPLADDSAVLSEIRIARVEYINLFDQGFLVDILVRYNDGTTAIREVTTVTPGASFDTIETDTPLPQNATFASVRRIEFLTLHRLSTDVLDFRHEWVSPNTDFMKGEVLVQVSEIIE